MRTRSWWGWGWTDEALSDGECAALGSLVPGLPGQPLPVPDPKALDLPAARIAPPAPLAHLCSADPLQRLSHARGKAYRDVMRALHGVVDPLPDLVAAPQREQDVTDLLDWAADAGLAVVPFGGGSSVTGGVEYRGDTHRGVISLDLTALDQVLEIDRTGRAARIQAGIFGPQLEDRLRAEGMTLRHFPQSFEFSTLGGWLATRAGGHFATGPTRIDAFVQSLRVVTPAGVSQSWRLPSSGAGPSPDALFLGSEGTLGVITEAWMRLQERPVFKESAALSFDGFAPAVEAARAIVQSGLTPANCRLLDPVEAAVSGASPQGKAMLLLGFESAQLPVSGHLQEAVAIALGNGGKLHEAAGAKGTATRSWRSAFLRMPYQRDALARMSAIVETFETACTWDRLPGLYEDVQQELGTAIRRITGTQGLIHCRLTHLYPDGAAPYFTVIAAGRRGAEVEMWDEIKSAAMDLLLRHRATVTHHHAVGRDHRPGYDRQRPDPYALALRAAKAALDPAGVLNPGVLVD
ncbi:FAD-binding oxidoreductase (plasmid) [Kitasatospora sp. NBC_00070]|uniref:FAD-binding oxidoreductase n=1 Tax=Kitasatospora sp. NBC_00070 TaxID=2975962 RepID=UPI002F915273